MLASECSFDGMMIFAIANRSLAEATSFIQVEFGMVELQTCWAGFVDSSDSYGQVFSTKEEIYAEFAFALSEYIEYLNEPALK